ncbi:MAG: hypothetical protein AAF639_44485, partial [Chloroflexota bacterium]
MDQAQQQLDYHSTSFTQGRMNFEWEELTDDDIRMSYDNWEAGKGFINGDPRRMPFADQLPPWSLNRHFFRLLAMTDTRGGNGATLTQLIESEQPLEIEIGFGRGDFLLDRAQRYPDRLFLGYETKTKATRLCLQRAERLALENFWVSDDDCRFNMPTMIPDGRVDM